MVSFEDFLKTNNIDLPVGHYNVQRADMPQIDNVEDLIYVLVQNNIKYERGLCDVQNLKLTQCKIVKDKVVKIMDNYTESEIVVANGFVIDGTHRFVAAYNMGLETIPCIHIDEDPIKMLGLLKDFRHED